MKPLTQKQKNIIVGVVVAVVVVAVVVVLLVLKPWAKPASHSANLHPVRKAAQLPDVISAVHAAFATKPPKNFPIDAVVTWVDGADKDWRARVAADFKDAKKQFPTVMHGTAREPIAPAENGHDELYYNVRLATKHMPWLRTYFVVSERPQKPAWWPADGTMNGIALQLVHHDDIARPPMMTLPTYNSAGIQTWLHNIPGLSEHFILFDDDFYVGRPMQRTDFFSDSGKPVVNMHMMNIKSIPPNQRQQSLWNRICLNTRQMALSVVGDKKPMVVPSHVCVPLIKSLYGKMITDWFRHEAGAFKRFRSPETDFVPHYLLLSILSILNHTKSPRKAISSWFHFAGKFEAAYHKARGMLPHMFCINDGLSMSERSIMEGIVNTLAA